MTLEEDKVQNNKNIPYNENSFSNEVFDILKKYETKSQEIKRFSMNKSPRIQKENVNEFVESFYQEKENDKSVNGIKKSIDNSTNILIEQAKSMIEKYIQTLGIKGDIKSTLEGLKINVRETTDDFMAFCNGQSIHINEQRFNKSEDKEKLHYLIHEILHQTSTILNKYTYDINFGIDGGGYQIDRLILASQIGYCTQRTIGKYKKGGKYGNFVNEGITDLITVKIFSDIGLDHQYTDYRYNIRLIDNMLLYISQKTGVEYTTLLDLIIKGYFYGDYKVLQLFQKILGADFGEILMREQETNMYRSSASLREKRFFEKYPFMKIEGILMRCTRETLSNNLQSFLGHKKN